MKLAACKQHYGPILQNDGDITTLTVRGDSWMQNTVQNDLQWAGGVVLGAIGSFELSKAYLSFHEEEVIMYQKRHGNEISINIQILIPRVID